MMVFVLSNMLCKGCKNVNKGAFLPRFCINIQNDRKIANKALFFHKVKNIVQKNIEINEPYMNLFSSK